MSTTTVSRESMQALAEASAKVNLLDQQFLKLEPRFQKFYRALRDAIDHEASEEQVALYRPQLAKVGDEIDECLDTIQQSLPLLARLRDDKDLMAAKFGHVEHLVQTMALTRKLLSEHAAQARELDGRVDKALTEIRKGALSAEADLGALQARVKSLMKTIAVVDVEAPKLEQAARKAWDRKDQKALTDARVKLIDYLKLGAAAKAMRPAIERFQKQYPDLDRERKAEAQWLLDDVERADDSIERVAKAVKALVALGQVPKEDRQAAASPVKFSADEVTKVLKAFELPINDADKRGKATKLLGSHPVEQWSKELAKVYGARESELKARLSSVRKLSFVKQLGLIDI